MDDLSSIDWNAKAPVSQPLKPASNNPFSSATSTLRPNPALASLSPQPQSRTGSTVARDGSASSPLKSVSPANDSFSNLLPGASNKAKSNLTLQDRQRQLQEERQRQIQEQQHRHAQEAQLWDKLGTGARGQAQSARETNIQVPGAGEDVDDILAAFNSSAKVDRSSHFPPPGSDFDSGRSTPAVTVPNGQSNGGTSNQFPDDDDDPFGLGSIPTSKPTTKPSFASNDDDILGDLGRPVQARPPPPPSPPRRMPSPEELETPQIRGTPFDRQIAELVDMGFPADRAQIALQETNGNLQTAVSWLLNQAHAEAQAKVKGSATGRTQSPMKQPEPHSQGSVPAWMRADSSRSNSQQRRPDSAASGDKDVSQYASDVGSAFFKSANSLWKAGRKQVQKAVSDFQQEGDPNQPKWMRDASADSRKSDVPPQPPRPQQNGHGKAPAINMTDEAALLEAGEGRPKRSAKASPRIPQEPLNSSPLRGRSPAQVLPERSAPPQQRFPSHPTNAPRQPTKLSREQVEAQTSQAYVSSARRRKPATPAAPTKSPEPEVDLFNPAPGRASPAPSAPRPQTSTARPSVSPAPPKPKAPPRSVPAVSPSLLSASASHRSKGTDAFKRGDYDAAHQSYSSSLSGLPSSHPIRIIILSNRSLTALKTGDPKLAISDADEALTIIGPSKGENESIDLGADGTKNMRDFYGKALSRKAEALEALEKWSDAAAVWKDAVESGLGGAVAARGRERCIKAANPSKPTPKPAARLAKPAPRPAARAAVAGAGASQEAVKKLRAQNAAAEKLDDERFALTDAVSARIEAWKGGKADNLRALLGSLENVLWEGAGWKKVGMAELIQTNRVKIVYMKAIAKVHPDKIAQDATTEQRMISGSVFSTLNEAWDKFKAENGL
ncbi:UBA/TS-N domain-containing protein [Elsinoe fawcettii]|nr:UBA/TS-N domain-containing protein [Elsinoe fawcettii]